MHLYLELRLDLPYGTLRTPKIEFLKKKIFQSVGIEPGPLDLKSAVLPPELIFPNFEGAKNISI